MAMFRISGSIVLFVAALMLLAGDAGAQQPGAKSGSKMTRQQAAQKCHEERVQTRAANSATGEINFKNCMKRYGFEIQGRGNL
jgi:hypothetical protein